MNLEWEAVSCTRKVPFELVRTGLSTSPILPGQRHFPCLNDQAGSAARRKPEVRDSGEPARLAEEVRAAAPTGRSGALVGIDGPGGSGKSTLADVLAAEIADAVVVHGDDFYRPSADRQRGTAASGGQFDLDRLLRQVVAPAASGGAVRYQWYDWSRDELAEWIPVPAGVTVIVEGVYCTELRLRDYYDYRIFCVADQAVRLRRGLERDGEAARSHWLDDWIPAEDRYIAGQRPDLAAQVVLASDGSDDDSAPVFRRVELSA